MRSGLVMTDWPVLCWRMSRWGVWRLEHGLEVLAADRWELRRDLSGVQFRASTAHEPPYVDVAFVGENNNNNFPPGYQAGLTNSNYKLCQFLSHNNNT